MADWNMNCCNCTYSKNGLACDRSACSYMPPKVVYQNHTELRKATIEDYKEDYKAGYGNVAEARREAVKEFAAKASSILDELEPLSIQQRKIALLQIAAEFGVTEVGK